MNSTSPIVLRVRLLLTGLVRGNVGCNGRRSYVPSLLPYGATFSELVLTRRVPSLRAYIQRGAHGGMKLAVE